MTITRDRWEEPGYRVADHTTSPPVDFDALDTIVVHYPGGRVTVTDPVHYVRAVQRSYVSVRRYSIGYNVGVWLDGTEIELRGDAFRNAGNAVAGDDGATNRRTLSIFVIVDGQAPAAGVQVQTVRRIVDRVQRRVGRPLAVVGHGELEPTACPGAGISAQLTAGMFVVPYPNPQLEVYPMPDDAEYIALPPRELQSARNPSWFYVSGAQVRPANQIDVAAGGPLAGLPQHRMIRAEYDALHEHVIGRKP